MNNKDLAKKKLTEIVQELKTNYDTDKNPSGLFGGSIGVSFFLLLDSMYSRDVKTYNFAFDILEQTISDLSITKSFQPTFSAGLAGIGWALEYLNQKGIIDVDTDSILSEFDDYLNNAQKEWLNDSFYDFMYGGGGIFLYYLKRLEGKTKFSSKIKQIIIDNIHILISNGDIDHDTTKWKSTVGIEKNEIGYSVSLSHGLTSILVILSKIISTKMFSDYPLIYETYVKVRNYILTQELLVDYYGCHFPNWSIESEEFIQPSGLSWCYGDLGIARGLLLSGRNLKDKQLSEKAMQVLKYSGDRKKLTNDACLCHGSSGVALSFILPPSLVDSESINYTSTVEFWICETLKMLHHEDGIAGYKYFSPSDRPIWRNDRYSILEGVSGVGLTLLTYLDNTYVDWTEMLLYK